MNTSNLTLAKAQALVSKAAANRSKAHDFAYNLHKHDPREAQAWADLREAEAQMEIAGKALAEALKQPNANGKDDVSSSGHTPGPWKVNCDPDVTSDVWTDRPNGTRQFISICPDVKLLGRELTHQKWRSNARLIAAAPELLKIAQHIAAMENDAFLMEHPEWVAIAEESRAAITKATQA